MMMDRYRPWLGNIQDDPLAAHQSIHQYHLANRGYRPPNELFVHLDFGLFERRPRARAPLPGV